MSDARPSEMEDGNGAAKAAKAATPPTRSHVAKGTQSGTRSLLQRALEELPEAQAPAAGLRAGRNGAESAPAAAEDRGGGRGRVKNPKTAQNPDMGAARADFSPRAGPEGKAAEAASLATSGEDASSEGADGAGEGAGGEVAEASASEDAGGQNASDQPAAAADEELVAASNEVAGLEGKVLALKSKLARRDATIQQLRGELLEAVLAKEAAEQIAKHDRSNAATLERAIEAAASEHAEELESLTKKAAEEAARLRAEIDELEDSARVDCAEHAAEMKKLCTKHQAELDALKKEHKTELLEVEIRRLQEQNQTLEEAKQRRARFALESANKRFEVPSLSGPLAGSPSLSGPPLPIPPESGLAECDLMADSDMSGPLRKLAAENSEGGYASSFAARMGSGYAAVEDPSGALSFSAHSGLMSFCPAMDTHFSQGEAMVEVYLKSALPPISSDLTQLRRKAPEKTASLAHKLGDRPPGVTQKEITPRQWTESFAMWVAERAQDASALTLLHCLQGFELVRADGLTNPFVNTEADAERARAVCTEMCSTADGRAQLARDWALTLEILKNSISKSAHHDLFADMLADVAEPSHVKVAKLIRSLVTIYVPQNVSAASGALMRIIHLAESHVPEGGMKTRVNRIVSLCRIYKQCHSGLKGKAHALNPAAIYHSFIVGIMTKPTPDFWRSQASLPDMKSCQSDLTLEQMAALMERFSLIEDQAGPAKKVSPSNGAHAAGSKGGGAGKKAKAAAKTVPPTEAAAAAAETRSCWACGKADHAFSRCNDFAALKKFRAPGGLLSQWENDPNENWRYVRAARILKERDEARRDKKSKAGKAAAAAAAASGSESECSDSGPDARSASDLRHQPLLEVEGFFQKVSCPPHLPPRARAECARGGLHSRSCALGASDAPR